MFVWVLKVLMVTLLVAVGVAFYTLLERKVLSYIQLRKGPNKVGICGIPQPLGDAAKLFTKEDPQITKANKWIYFLRPVVRLIIAFTLWILYTSFAGFPTFELGILFFLTVSRLNVYTILVAGWASNSKYALLGGVRAVAQTISYEVRIALVLIVVLGVSATFSLEGIFINQSPWFALRLFPVAIIWFISALAETNRAPFDLAEGESELVSGFNIEYGGGEFAMLFIAEYARILLIRLLSASLFMAAFLSGIGFPSLCKFIVVALWFLWVRGSYPRVRYDRLMALTWKTFLRFLLGFLSILTVLMGRV